MNKMRYFLCYGGYRRHFATKLCFQKCFTFATLYYKVLALLKYVRHFYDHSWFLISIVVTIQIKISVNAPHRDTGYKDTP